MQFGLFDSPPAPAVHLDPMQAMRAAGFQPEVYACSPPHKFMVVALAEQPGNTSGATYPAAVGFGNTEESAAGNCFFQINLKQG